MMYFSVMSRFHALFASLAALFLLLGSGPAAVWAQGQQSTQAEIRQMLEQRDQQIKAILGGDTDYTQEQRDRLKELINGVLDFRAMAQTALGPHWDTLSTDRRDSFVEVFRDVVRAQSMGDLDVYNSKVTFDQISVQGDSAFVRTTTEYEGTQTPVEYVLARRDDEWKAEDIIVDDVSTAEGYARSFQTVVRKRGFSALMKSLRKKREEISGNQGK
jgi:phospholipid transport system substrate-binding protein